MTSLQEDFNNPQDEKGEEDRRPMNKMTCKEIHKEKMSIMKNIISISMAMTFLFTSYFSMENLQSSINKRDGTTSLAAIYASFIISSCLLSTLLLRTLKAKYTLFVCSVFYVTYMLAQLHPKIYLLVPTAILLGLAAGPLWAAQGTYITKAGTRYATLTGEKSSVVIARFFSIFYMLFQSTQVWGNLISSSVLSLDTNGSALPNNDTENTCGYRFCISGRDEGEYDSQKNLSNIHQTGPPKWQIHALTAFYISGAILSSAIILVIVDPLKKFQPRQENTRNEGANVCQLLSATFQHMKHPYQILLIPLSVWSGIERAFLGADFSAAFVSCTQGVHMVGYTMICYGVCDIIGSMSASHLVKAFGRIPVITLAFLINMSVIIAVITWLPSADHTVWYFVITGLWGLADAVWMTQMNTLYSVLFPDNIEPAFSNYNIWGAMGFALSFGLSSALCLNAKIIVVILSLILGVMGYYFIEFMERMGGIPKNKEDNSDETVSAE